jgi:hypothetical protein
MNKLLLTGGQLIGLLGVVLVVVSAVARLAGAFWLAGFATGTLMLAGIAAVTTGAFLLLCMLVRTMTGPSR